MESSRVVRMNSGTNEFCIGRMVTKFGLVTIGATRDLRAAKARLAALTESRPGEYVVFLRNTGRVVAKARSEFQRGRTIANQWNEVKGPSLRLEHNLAKAQAPGIAGREYQGLTLFSP